MSKPLSRPVAGRTRSRPPAVASLLAVIALLGCGGEESTPTGLTPDTFMDVVVELREAERQAVETDSAAVVYDRLKAEVLERHGTSDDEIRAFVEATHRDLPLQAEMWDEISERLRRPLDAEDEGPALPGRQQ